MALSIDDIIWAHYHQILDLVVSPDDQEVLVVFGNNDMPHESYAIDERNRSLWRLRLADDQTFQLASPEEDAHAPCWSPDGHEIAYLTRRSGQTEIWVINRDGTDPHQITHSNFPAQNPFDGSSFCWSPDGMSIAYTTVPNGSRYALAIKEDSDEDNDQILVRTPMTDEERQGTNEERLKFWNHPPTFVGEVNIIHSGSGQNRRLVTHSGDDFHILCWFADSGRLLVRVGSELKEITISTGQMRSLYSGPSDVVILLEDDIHLAHISGSRIEVGFLQNGSFNREHSIEIAGHDIQLGTWSPDGSRLFGTVQEGVTTYLFTVDLHTSRVQMLTPTGRMASNPRCLNQEDTVVFPYQGPTEPSELWLHKMEGAQQKVSNFNGKLVDVEMPEVRIIHYPSDDWMIEALLVLPLHYLKGKKYPTIVYLHGGPENHVSACFTDLVSARAQSVAHYLAGQDYAVLLPNFRGSSGYGPECERELGNYQIMRKPFKDLMAGIDFVVSEGIADPEMLGIYGSSFGGWLTAWTISQTNCFKAAIPALGFYDLLRLDRSSGKPFYSLEPNRLGDADPMAMWFQPEIYKDISPMENIRSIKTPVLIIETGAEHRHGQAGLFFDGLCALGVETYLIYYPKAFHNGGWNDEYKRDYMNRLVAWFNHCLKNAPLPNWFK